ncbi:MAG: putative rane-bound dehydrogenase domain protein [Fibrobacteres bacterium]|nr:putative rane-bound dehydrogenase domain protein [Fibrobacterota bacterium]
MRKPGNYGPSAFTFPAYASAILAAAVLTAPCAPKAQQGDVWMKLMDGKDLTGWKYRAGNWKVDAAAGSAIGSGSISFNTFLITDSLFSDFHFKVDARMPGTGGKRNSGVVYRGKISNAANFEVGGYQADISDGFWGSFYHEQGTELPWTPVSTCSPAAKTDWATLEIIANKDKVTHLVNGKTCWEHSGFKVLDKGIIALQLHNPGDFSVEFKNVFIQPLNASFTIPADKAYDKDGKPITVVGIGLATGSGWTGHAARSGRSMGPGATGLSALSLEGLYDAAGRAMPSLMPRAGSELHLAKTGFGKDLSVR